MKKISGRAGAVLALVTMGLLPHTAAAAAKYDGSTPLLCVPIIINECGPDGTCRHVTADSVNLPQFVKVDVKSHKMHSEETGRASTVGSVEHANGDMILHGGQDGRGWTMTISEETGKMLATITADGAGFVVFGACTPQ
jgi:hypothetical protein